MGKLPVWSLEGFFYKFNTSSAEGCGITGPSFTYDAVFVVIYCDKVEYVEKM